MARLLELTLQSRFAGQIFLNRFNYVWDSASPSPGGLSQKLIEATGVQTITSGGTYTENTLIYAIQRILHTTCTFEIMTARDVDNVFDIAEFLFPTGSLGQGFHTGESAPPFMAMGFRSSKSRSDIKRGAKRFSGLPGDFLSNAGIFTGTALNLGDDVAAAMSSPLSDGEGTDFLPAVTHKKREQVIEGTTPTGKFKYVYWGDPDLNVQNSMYPVSWGVGETARSQTSRQYGRGR